MLESEHDVFFASGLNRRCSESVREGLWVDMSGLTLYQMTTLKAKTLHDSKHTTFLLCISDIDGASD